MKTIIILGAFALALGGCTAAQVATTQTDVTAACTAAPLLDASANAATKADVAAACAAEVLVAPVVAPLVTKSAAVVAAPATP